MKDGVLVENRLCRRFDVKGCMIALGSVQGQLMDISFAGLSFCYRADDDVLKPETEYGAIFGGNDLFFEKIRLRTVSDVAVKERQDATGVEYRRRGMEFGALTPPDFAVLARVIRQHALSM